jgi:MoaA/NifB/PqqE/SkfB family radical SAM enzyme
MKRFVRYQNGNYSVVIDLKTGTKIRENDLNFFRADFPESMDIKITNRCDMGCPQCHENSTKDGLHGDIMSEGFIDKLHPYTELAIGGGNPLEHPDLVPFLEKCKRLNLIPSMTVNQFHFMRNKDFLKRLVEKHLIYGLGVSLTHANEEFIEVVKEFPNAVIHVINGIVHPVQLEALANNGFKILILGYKEFRRGEIMYQHQSVAIEQLKQMLYDRLSQIIRDGWFEVVSFDNLAITQLDAHRLMSNEDWEQFYMGDDGSATMYVDMVNREFAKSSTSTERYPLEDDIVTMFEKIRTN